MKIKLDKELVCPSCGEWFANKAKCPDCSFDLVSSCPHCGQLKAECVCDKEEEEIYYLN